MWMRRLRRGSAVLPQRTAPSSYVRSRTSRRDQRADATADTPCDIDLLFRREARAAGACPPSHLALLFRREAGRAVAALIRATGSFDLAEEAVQDAFVQALRLWPKRGVPNNPAAWITLTARNKVIDRLRREQVGAVKAGQAEELLALEGLGDDVHQIPDERLRLIFTCCHPALAMEARVALTLRTVGGLSS